MNASGVLAGKDLTQVAPGSGYHTCMLDAAGAAYCWGDNTFGALGDGTTASSLVPVTASTVGQHFTQLGGGFYHSCGLDASGAAWCWGAGTGGQLGDNSAGSLVPVRVGLDAPAAVAASTAAGAAVVTWRTPPSLDGGALNGYTATASPGGATCTSPSADTCTITGLADGTAYNIAVVTSTTLGNSGPSVPAAVTISHGPSGPITFAEDSTRCIGTRGGSLANDAPVVAQLCGDSAAQDWTVEADCVLQAAGKCLDIYRSASIPGTPVEMWDCTSGANQRWRVSDGALLNPRSGMCLYDPGGTSGTQLVIATCDRGAGQQWTLP